MHQTIQEQPKYRNWVALKLIYVPLVLTGCTAVLTLYYPWVKIFPPLFLLMMLYFLYARYLFSPKGKNLQVELQRFLVNEISWNGKGKVLDIGCGNGALAIRLAKKYPNATVVGVEYRNFDHAVCMRNAELENVADRVSFQQSTIVDLPFEDGRFNLVVSNLTFHEVTEIKDRRRLLEEAIRVLDAGGVFVFQDLFLTKKVFGNLNPFLDMVAQWGAESVEFVNVVDSDIIPGILKTPFMIGSLGIIKGNT